MVRASRLRQRIGVISLVSVVAAIAAGVFWAAEAKLGAASQAALRRPVGYAQLVSYEPLPVMDGEMCRWVPASATIGPTAALLPIQESGAVATQALGEPRPTETARAEVAKRGPVRVIRDSYSANSGIAVDPVHNEVVMTDENLFGILVYDRLDSTPPTATMSEPKRIIRGMRTEIEFQCSLYVDPATGDIYAVNNDTVDKLVIFSRQAKGDVAPDRVIETPHTTFGIAVDEEEQEMFLTIQDDHAVVVYPKAAEGEDDPIRLLQGDRTLLADPHGIALDPKNNLLFVANWGSTNERVAPAPGSQDRSRRRGFGRNNWPVHRSYSVPGSGKFMPPSITVYPMDAKGDTPPLRVIQGSKTQLNWASALAVDPERGELYVANDTADNVLVFNAAAEGDAEPLRVLQGPRTLIKNPTGLYLDLKNDELWVANFGNHTATVFQRTAAGDTPPLRVIRSAPLDAPAPMLSNAHAVTYDTKREEILVVN